MALLASLVTRLSLESASFSTGMKNARRQTTSDTAAMAKSLDSLNSKLNAFGKGLTLAAFGAVAKRALEYASSLGEVSQQLGVTAKDLQIYRYAASQVGIEQEAMDKGLQKLTQNMGKAEVGSKPLQAAFSAIGISLADLKGKTAGDTIPKIADGLAKIPDPARRAAVEVALFGKAGQQLDTLLAGGSRGINQLAKEAKDLGLVLSNRQIQDADALADKLSALKQVLEARIAGTVADNANSILSLANALGNLSGRIIQFINSNPAKASALIAGLAAGALTKSPIAAAGAALLAGGLAAEGGVDSLRSSVNSRARFIHEQYIRRGGTEDEWRSKKFNQSVINDPHMRVMRNEFSALQERLKAAQGGSVAAGPAATLPDAQLPQFLAGGGGKPKSAPDHSEQRAKEALRLSYEMDKEELDGKRDILQAQQDITDDYEARAEQAKQLADVELQSKQRSIKFDLDMVLVDKTISDKQKEEAKARAAKAMSLAEQLHQFDEQKILTERDLQRQRDASALEDQRFDARRETLQSEEQLATTAAERRKIELELLDLAYQQRKINLQHIQNDKTNNGSFVNDPGARARAAEEEAHLDAGYGTAKQGVLNSTRGPLESFLSGLPDTAAKANEALQAVAAEGLQSITDGLTDAIMGAKSLGQAFSAVAKQIVADLIKIAIQKAIVGTLGKVLGGLGGKTNALTGSGKSFITGSFSDILPGRAVGGPVGAGRPYIVGEKGPELFIPQLSGNIMTNSALRGRSATSPNGGGQTRISVVPSPYFNVVVDERAANIAIPIGAAASASGSADAQQTLVRRASRRLP